MRRFFGNKDCIEKVKILQRKVQRLGVPQKERLFATHGDGRRIIYS